MKRSRFTEKQIIGVLREQEAGALVADLCRRDPETVTGIGAAPPRKLRTDARCYRRAHAQFSTSDSSDPWMNVGGHVNPRLRPVQITNTSPSSTTRFDGSR